MFFSTTFPYGKSVQTREIFRKLRLCRLSCFQPFSPWKGVPRDEIPLKNLFKMAENRLFLEKKFLNFLKKVFLARKFLTAIWWKNGRRARKKFEGGVAEQEIRAKRFLKFCVGWQNEWVHRVDSARIFLENIFIEALGGAVLQRKYW